VVRQRNFAELLKTRKTSLLGFEGLQTLQNLLGRLLAILDRLAERWIDQTNIHVGINDNQSVWVIFPQSLPEMIWAGFGHWGLITWGWGLGIGDSH
jgi:hypothetical protein